MAHCFPVTEAMIAADLDLEEPDGYIGSQPPLPPAAADDVFSPTASVHARALEKRQVWVVDAGVDRKERELDAFIDCGIDPVRCLWGGLHVGSASPLQTLPVACCQR